MSIIRAFNPNLAIDISEMLFSPADIHCKKRYTKSTQ